MSLLQLQILLNSGILIHPWSSFRDWACLASAKTKKRHASQPSFSSTPFTSWPERMRLRKVKRQVRCLRHARLNNPSSSPSFTITSPSRVLKPSASNTGHWKRPSCNACLWKPSSAGRFFSSLEARTVSAGKPHSCLRKKAPTSSSPISIWRASRKLRPKPADWDHPNPPHTRRSISVLRKAFSKPQNSRSCNSAASTEL